MWPIEVKPDTTSWGGDRSQAHARDGGVIDCLGPRHSRLPHSCLDSLLARSTSRWSNTSFALSTVRLLTSRAPRHSALELIPPRGQPVPWSILDCPNRQYAEVARITRTALFKRFVEIQQRVRECRFRWSRTYRAMPLTQCQA